MKTIKVSEASGPVLDWMVAKCEGHVENGVYGEPVLRDGQLHIHYCGVVLDNVWCPSTGWAQGGPIIDAHKISTDYAMCYGETKCEWEAVSVDDLRIGGPTPLIAAMRCYVASKLGEEADVPEELLRDGHTNDNSCQICGADGGTTCGAVNCGGLI